jgi:endothelin-converting enzyme/putative endopeptidase
MSASTLLRSGFLLALPLTMAALSLPASAQKAPSTQKPSTARPAKPIPGFDTAIMDTSADPCANFYEYACGNFAKMYPIPGDLPLYDQFENLNDYTRQLLRGLLEQAAKPNPNRSPDAQKAGDYYASCMDTGRINADGLKPLKAELDRIDALKSKKQLPALLAHYQMIDVTSFFSLGSMPDFKDATQEIAVVDQGGLGLPERGYYLRTDPRSVRLQKEYVQHIANMLHLYGEPKTKAMADAKAVMKLETALAKASMGMVERRNPHKTYHMETLAALAATNPGLEWKSLIRDTGAPEFTKLNVANPAFFNALHGILQQTSLATIKAYLRVHLLDAFASRLPKSYYDESFTFYNRELTGTPQMPPRWKLCVRATDAALGQALGKLYVDKYFAGNSKQQTLAMVNGIEAAMRKDLKGLTWMSPETKVKALHKLSLITNKIGYPNKWRDYSKLTIAADEAVGNSIRAREFESARQLRKIGKPVNKQEWEMSPPTVNAYYDPSMNNINFPAGILQPPFYDPAEPQVVNYGHIGAVVGHELTHGFDDEGSQFDGYGNLKNWWTPGDKKRFDERTACIDKEYSGFKVVDNLHINGKESLGENTADNGGLRLAFMAMTAYARQHNIDLTKKMGGYTPEQKFFIGYAQNWCTNDRPAFLRLLIQSDPHSPDKFRVNGVVRNMPAFASAFGCKKGQPMAPVDRCRVW